MKVRELYEAINTGFWLRRDDDGEWLRPATKAEVKAFQKAVKKDMNATITVNGEEVHISKKSGLLARLQKAAVKEGEEVRVKDLEDISEDYRRRIQNEEQFEKPSYKADFHAGFKAGKKALLKDPYAPLPKREPKGHGITWKDGFNAAIAMSRGLHGLEVYKTAKNQGLSQKRLIDNRGRVIEDVQPIASEILESLKMDWPAAASSVASTQLDKLYDDLNAFKKRHGRKVPSTTRRNIERALDSLVSLNAQLKRAEEGLYQ